jgi:hypothetical protein
VVQQPKSSLSIAIERIVQPESDQMTIVNTEYPILTPGQNTSLALQVAQDSMFDLSAWDMPRIKWPTGGDTHWTYMTAQGPQSTDYLVGILVYFKEGYDFWSHIYGEEESGPPECSSNDGKIGVGTPGGHCKHCQYHEWGSRALIDPKSEGSQAKACRHSTRMFLIQHGSTMPTLIVAPPTSVKALRRYNLQLAGTNLFYFGVETHLGLQPKQSGRFTVAELNPVQGRVLNNDQVKEAFRMWGTFREMYEGNPRATQQEAGSL